MNRRVGHRSCRLGRASWDSRLIMLRRLIFLGAGHGVIESLGVMAVEAAPGQRVPMDLSLVEAGGVFEPRTPSVGVRIPKELQRRGGSWGDWCVVDAGNYRWSACWWGKGGWTDLWCSMVGWV